MNEKKISDIKQQLDDTSIETLSDFIDEYVNDGRPGVAKLIDQAVRKMDKLRVERERL